MVQANGDLIDWTVFSETRATLGADCVRILGYFREDGTKSVAKIEEAMREKDAAQIVVPAHTLKGESAQLGATKLSMVAEQIEMTARKCVEHHEEPDEILELVVGLRPLFEQTLSALDKESSPIVQRQPHSFGRRAGNGPAFGVNR